MKTHSAIAWGPQPPESPLRGEDVLPQATPNSQCSPRPCPIMESHLTDITRVIQLSVAPAFLLVAMGTLITILSNRLARIVDRRRVVQERPGALASESAGEQPQEMALLIRRGNLIYFAILFAVLGALLVCLVVAGAFLGALLSVELAQVVAGLFVLAMVAMVAAWSLFLGEVYLAVRAGTHNRR